MADADEAGGAVQANDLVGSVLQILTGTGRADRNSDDNFGCAVLAQRRYRCAHRRTGGKPVVDQNDGATFEIGRRPIVAVISLPPFQLLAFEGGYYLDDRLRISDDAEDILVKHADATGRNGAHGEFFVSRKAEFADDKNIERNIKPLRDFKCDWNATTRESENNNIVASGVTQQFFRELPTRLCPVLKNLESRHGRSTG